MTYRSGTKAVRPLQGHSPPNRTGKPGGYFFIVKENYEDPFSATSPNNTGAPQYAFSRQGGIYRSDVVKPKPSPGAGANLLPSVGPPGPGKRTRREDHALLIVRDEFRAGYSLIGLLASRARLRFTGIARIN